MNVAEWHPYADRWYRGTLTCDGCGAVKPTDAHPTGWYKRFRAKVGRTEVRCPDCAKKETAAQGPAALPGAPRGEPA